jgi:hypothetical protein
MSWGGDVHFLTDLLAVVVLDSWFKVLLTMI